MLDFETSRFTEARNNVTLNRSKYGKINETMSQANYLMDAMFNRGKLREMLKPSPDDKDDEPIIFIINAKNTSFSIDLNTILDCVRLAEEQGVIFQLPEKFTAR